MCLRAIDIASFQPPRLIRWSTSSLGMLKNERDSGGCHASPNMLNKRFDDPT
jgi:hypothetical protein